jgi:hypothetical protein
MLLIYTPSITNRLKYTCDLILNQLLGIEYRFELAIPDTNLPKAEAAVTYHCEVAEIPSIYNAGLMFETGVRPLKIEASDYNDMPVFFCKKGSASLPFDVFSASFFLVSRYEEYLPYTPDAHNRFPAEASILYKNHWQLLPLVNLWSKQLLKKLLEYFPNLNYKERKFEYRSTIDIDMAFKYSHKGLLRHLGGLTKDIFGFKKEKLKERWNLFTGQTSDPFDNFEYQNVIHQKYQTRVNYFVLLGDYGPFDKNTHYKNLPFRQLIRQLDLRDTVGIHPSYASNKLKYRIETEKMRLENILGREVSVSRQHFLMHRMPETYRRIESIGIKEDHTMGYTTNSGFRAGIAAPFFWYDLQNETITDLLCVPFCHMDITPRHYFGWSVEKSKKELTLLMESVHRANGLFVSLWHNESLSDSEQWRGWKQLYQHKCEEGRRLQNI